MVSSVGARTAAAGPQSATAGSPPGALSGRRSVAGHTGSMSWSLAAPARVERGGSWCFMVNALLPVRRNRWLFVPSFVASGSPSSWPGLHLVVGVVGAGAARLARARSTTGRLGRPGPGRLCWAGARGARVGGAAPHRQGRQRRRWPCSTTRSPTPARWRSPAPATCPTPRWPAARSSSTCTARRPARRRGAAPGGAADPRRRLGHRRQARAGHPAAEAPGPAAGGSGSTPTTG